MLYWYTCKRASVNGLHSDSTANKQYSKSICYVTTLYTTTLYIVTSNWASPDTAGRKMWEPFIGITIIVSMVSTNNISNKTISLNDATTF